MPIIDIPFQRIAVDLIGPFSPTSKTGCRWVLTVMDVATRFPEAIPLKAIDTVTVAEALMTIFSRVGYPEEILSDCGSQFISDLMKEIYRLLSIRSVHTSPYHAQANGLVERFNGTLKTMLKKVVKTHPDQWDRYIPALLFSYRELPNESTGFSPFQLLFGRQPRGPIDILARTWTETDDRSDGKPLYQYVTDLKTMLKENVETVKDNVEHATDRHKFYHDKKTVDRTFETNDLVLVLLPTDSNKLLMCWKGPYKVTKTMGCDYEIEIGKNRHKVYHANLLQKYYQRNIHALFCSSLDDDENFFFDDSTNVSNIDELPFVTCVPIDVPIHTCVGVVIEANDDCVKIPTIPSMERETIHHVHIDENLTGDQKDDMYHVLTEFKDIFTSLPGCVDIDVVHEINLTDDTPVRLKPYPLPFASRQTVEKEVHTMLEMGVIEQSKSPYSSPIVLVKKPDGTVRFCIDFRHLNKLTVFDAEPIPNVDELFCRLKDANFFTKIDLAKGYWQIPMKTEDKEKTAFQTPLGLFHWTRMPFGLVTAPATFARMMRTLQLDQFSSLNFFDDILIASTTWAMHLKDTEGVLRKLKQTGLTVRPSKMYAGFTELDFLGHVISAGTVKPQSTKIEKILSLQIPKTKKQVRSLLGLLNYYRKFVPQFATITAPLTNLTKGTSRKPIVWTNECDDAVNMIQKIMATYPVLRLPDLSLQFVVRTDASATGIGAVLLQDFRGKLHPVKFVSRKLLTREQNYSAIERECLAIVWSVEKMTRYLWGKPFTLQTDHKPLAYLQSANFRNQRVTRWALYLQQYAYTVQAIQGSSNVFADFLSRADTPHT